jgi:hypothetical protein
VELVEFYVCEFLRVNGVVPVLRESDRITIRRAIESLVPELGMTRLKQLIVVGLERGSTIMSVVRQPSRFQCGSVAPVQVVQPMARTPRNDWRNVSVAGWGDNDGR